MFIDSFSRNFFFDIDTTFYGLFPPSSRQANILFVIKLIKQFRFFFFFIKTKEKFPSGRKPIKKLENSLKFPRSFTRFSLIIRSLVMWLNRFELYLLLTELEADL